MVRKIVLVVIFAILAFSLVAESLNLEITPSTMVYNYFYPAYLDPGNPDMQPVLFVLNAYNTENYDITDYQVQLSLQWREHQLVDDLIVEPKPGTPYAIIPAGESISITSQQLIVSEEAQFFSAVNGIDFDDIMDNSGEFQDLVLQLGYFPDGDYVFTVQMINAAGAIISNPATFTFTIIAPTAITLISPGNPLGLGPAIISDSYPYFVWFSNMTDFTFVLYELQGGEENDEEIEQQSEVIYETDISGNLVYSYPSTAPFLEENQLYAWQIRAVTTSPLTDEGNLITSNIYLFSISSDQEVNQNNQILINFLQQLQIEGMDEIISLLEEGYDFDNIIWHGEEMGIEGLNDFLQQIVNGEIEIKNMTIE